jgi:hypothetical protein
LIDRIAFVAQPARAPHRLQHSPWTPPEMAGFCFLGIEPALRVRRPTDRATLLSDKSGGAFNDRVCACVHFAFFQGRLTSTNGVPHDAVKRFGFGLPVNRKSASMQSSNAKA